VQQSMRFSSDYVSSFCQRDSTLEVVRSARAWQGGGAGKEDVRGCETWMLRPPTTVAWS
jgi:hypothetical protein